MKTFLTALLITGFMSTNSIAGTCPVVELVDWDIVPAVELNCDTGDYVAACDLTVTGTYETLKIVPVVVLRDGHYIVEYQLESETN